MSMMTPKQIVDALDRYIIGQEEAKRAVILSKAKDLFLISFAPSCFCRKQAAPPLVFPSRFDFFSRFCKARLTYTVLCAILQM